MRPLDREQTRAQLERFRRCWRDDGLCQWAVDELDTGRFVGRVGIIRQHDWHPRPSAPEVGWTLDRAVHGRGYATEAGRAAVELWRSLLVDDPQLISITTPDNARSRGVMERLGLTLRGTTHWHGHDVVWYALDRGVVAT
jgi:RimJ/RimL family protein N-acetyltransferase